MYVGVDGCVGGWLAVCWNAGLSASVHPTIDNLWETYAQAEQILLDMPIGLAEDGARQCEIDARRMLGERRSSVFAVPVRSALTAPTYAEASHINQVKTGKKLSKQTWNIMPKIHEVDVFLRENPAAQKIVYESHPEVVFTALAGHPMRYSKKNPLGFHERLRLLTRFVDNAVDFIDTVYVQYRREVTVDDIVDALVLAIAARQPTLNMLPTNPPRDRYNLPMQIVYPEKPMKLERIHHVQITVSSHEVEAARAFYCDVLGLREVEKPDSLKPRGGFWLQIGDQSVHVGIQDDYDPRTTKAHIAYQVDNLNIWRERLQAEGIEIGVSVPIPGLDRFEFRDPFGNRVEFIQPHSRESE